ncbi:histone deacetylase 7 isoform X3 [Ambystoma mexicanum]|uniref:histone deacetylase 7 isoform X3 n=1 Tax=Ambystoma mexicanum TaxID=8296 RepID=UPI0037E845EE
MATEKKRPQLLPHLCQLAGKTPWAQCDVPHVVSDALTKLDKSTGQPLQSITPADVTLPAPLRVPQTLPMDLRMGQRLPKPCSDTTILTLKQTHQLPDFLFFGDPHQQEVDHIALQQMRLNMEASCREAEPGKQEELRHLLNKEKSKQSANASPAVKQKLANLIRTKQRSNEANKQQMVLERTSISSRNGPTIHYRTLEHVDPEPPSPNIVTNFVAQLATSPNDMPEHFPLRKTASEPNLKVRYKPKKSLDRRKNPLTRKESAPPMLKRRPPEALDSSPSSSSTPVSGCSSPNDSIPAENGSSSSIPGMAPETPLAQRLMMHESSLSQLAHPSAASLPTITLGLPATTTSPRGEPDRRSLQGLVHRVPVMNSPVLSGAHSQIFIPSGLEQHDPGNPLAPHMQSLIILEPSGTHAPLVTGLMPFHLAHPLIAADRLSVPSHHKPLGRTRSEPLPQNQKAVQQQQMLLQAQHAHFLDRLKSQTLLGKRVLEKPRLRQIPSEDMDADEGLQNEDRLQEGASERGDHCRGRGDPLRGARQEAMRDGGCGTKDQERSQQLFQQQHDELIHQQQAFIWEQHQRMQQQLKRHSPLETLGVHSLPGGHRPLSRAKSSPASATTSLPVQEPPSKTMALPSPEPSAKPRFTTGVVYDSIMLKHQCSCGDNSNHPEHAGRIQSIWSRLQETGLRNHCECIRGRKATLEELQSVHSERHVLLYGTNPLNRLKLDNRKLAGILSQRMFVMLPCGGVGVDSDTIWNELHSSNAARWAAGSVIELAMKVATRELKNGFAVVRPPGHHADPTTAMGFCFFNSVAIAARRLQQKLNVSKILIVDWDVHHGNGTQQVFYADPTVLYMSLHRHDDGNFFPGSGAAEEVGTGSGEGFNVNVAWTGGLDPPMGDPEYLAAFRTVVMPIAHEFAPDVVLVSAGFDAADGHPAPLGGYKVSAKCFGYMTKQLMSLAGGGVILALEGGHDLTAICDASETCVSALLGNELDPFPEEILRQRPNMNAIRSLERVIQVQGKYWRSVQRFASKTGYSFFDAQKHDMEEVETVTALASLSVGVNHRGVIEKSKTQDEPMEEEEPMSL